MLSQQEGTVRISHRISASHLTWNLADIGSTLLAAGTVSVLHDPVIHFLLLFWRYAEPVVSQVLQTQAASVWIVQVCHEQRVMRKHRITLWETEVVLGQIGRAHV